MIHYHTLNDHLFMNGITKKEACILFGRTPRTLKNWNEDPPEWVVRIVQLMGEKPAFPDCWRGWYFDREWIVDQAGNSYRQCDLQANVHYARSLHAMCGKEEDIYILKDELKNKIKALSSEISITVNVGKELKKEFKIAL